MEQFWGKYESKVADAPEEHGNSHVSAFVRVCKIQVAVLVLIKYVCPHAYVTPFIFGQK